MASKCKSEVTFPSSTLKVEEDKVPLFFRFVASGQRYVHFVISMIALSWSKIKKMRKWPYLNPEATNLKNKGTLFSSTLKAEEMKITLLFGF